MRCLWNGEYGDHDLSFVPSIDDIVERQEEQYEKYVGCVVGDFTCVKVEYDWGRRDQRWTVKCNLCGRTIYQYHANDWRRGKGRKTTCDCRKEWKLKEKEDARKERLEKIAQKQKDHIGKTYGDWKVIEYNGFQSCKIECVVCGITKKSKIDEVLHGNVVPCSHRKPRDYSGDEWIGRRIGHLTVIGRDGHMFVARCDCGKEILERPTILFYYKKSTCGDPDCEYSSESQRKSRKSQKIGHEFEQRVVEALKSRGYNAVLTKCLSDFGVDIIITESDGTKVAVQCKKQKKPVGVNAIQEVYAGGRFYDCTKFSVICDKGFSNPAIILARKLGVYLCDGEYAPPDDVSEYTATLLPIYHRNEKLEKLYEIRGDRHTLGDWCSIYGVALRTVRKNIKNGMTIEMALESAVDKVCAKSRTYRTYTVNGYTGSLSAVCEYYGIPPQTVSYRMKHRGMSIEEAIFTPTK